MKKNKKRIRRINIRRMQRDFYNQIKELPVVVTRNKKDALVILPATDVVLEKIEN